MTTKRRQAYDRAHDVCYYMDQIIRVRHIECLQHTKLSDGVRVPDDIWQDVLPHLQARTAAMHLLLNDARRGSTQKLNEMADNGEALIQSLRDRVHASHSHLKKCPQVGDTGILFKDLREQAEKIITALQ